MTMKDEKRRDYNEKRRDYNREHTKRIKREEEELDHRLAELKARHADTVRHNVLTKDRDKSVALLRASHARGMSRSKLVQIWGRQFVIAVLGEDVLNYTY